MTSDEVIRRVSNETRNSSKSRPALLAEYEPLPVWSLLINDSSMIINTLDFF